MPVILRVKKIIQRQKTPVMVTVKQKKKIPKQFASSGNREDRTITSLSCTKVRLTPEENDTSATFLANPRNSVTGFNV